MTDHLAVDTEELREELNRIAAVAQRLKRMVRHWCIGACPETSHDDLSDPRGTIECMFDPPEAPFGLLQRVCSATRARACAAADRLVAIGELVTLRMKQAGETAEWAVDATDAVTAEVAAALSISQQLAASYVALARALRDQLPLVGRAFIAGDLDEETFRTMVFRTGLITDDDILAEVDRQLSMLVSRWGPMNRKQLSARVDKLVAGVDVDAVRRRRDRVAGRAVVISDVDNGLAEIHATVTATDAHTTAERLTALANTVCEHDPRTLSERRADAFGAMAAHADHLGCRCGLEDCTAGGKTAGAVVIHVIAEQATVDGTGTTPAAMIGYEGLIPAELIADLAKASRLRPLVHPTNCDAEAGYAPSRALAEFVRSRDLTCRFPGCSAPATHADIDHTIPYGAGGPTQAGNLKCVCRLHHLLKTFWGWSDEELRDGTVIWTSPTGERYVTLPGSAWLFPGLCQPTRAVVQGPSRSEPCSDRSVMMPRRTRTREQNRAAAITAERHHNHELRTNPPTKPVVYDEDLF